MLSTLFFFFYNLFPHPKAKGGFKVVRNAILHYLNIAYSSVDEQSEARWHVSRKRGAATSAPLYPRTGSLGRAASSPLPHSKLMDHAHVRRSGRHNHFQA